MLLLILGGISLRAQTTLVAGDIGFTGYVSNLTGGVLGNEFSFVILRTGGISAGTTITFTDNGWNSITSALGTSEGTLTWTSTTALSQFTEVRINVDPTGATLESLSSGSVGPITGPFLLSQGGDQILAYQGSSSSPTFISGIQMNSEILSGSNAASTAASWDVVSSTGWPFTSTRSGIPPGLTSGTNALWGIISLEFDNGLFNCTNSTAPSLAALKAKLFDPTNWKLENPGTSGVYFSTPSGCTYAISSPPVITGNPPNRTICANGNTTFGVSATGALSYQWQVSTDGGINFADLANTAPYSGVTGTVLTITGASGALSGNRYRANAINTDGTTSSNSGILTVSNITTSVSSQTNIACFGASTGSATVSASGGISPYTYSWSPSGGTAALATGLTAGTYVVTITDNIGCTATQNVIITQPASGITASGSQTNTSCNAGTNGTATVVAGGGTGPYTYSWAPSGGTGATASGLGAGAYTVTITDAIGCTATRNFTITQPSALITSTSQTNVSCNGGSNGSASVTVSGGTPTYTYSWSPSGGTAATATGLTAGTYTVTITDANACFITRSFTITQPSLLTTTTAQTNVACNGGSNGVAAVVASGGTAPYSYLWSNGATTSTITGLMAGLYNVTVTDFNSCTSTKSVTVTQPSALAATTSQTNISCKGGANGAASVTASGGAGAYTYSWAPSGGTGATATGLTAGTYTVTITDANSCMITKAVILTEPATAITTSAAQTNVACNGGTNGSASVTASGGTGPYTYSWAPSGGTAATASGLTAGAYIVTITDANGCIATRNFTITQPSALSVATAQTNIACNGGSNGSAAVTVSGGTPSYTYLWSPSGGTASAATGLIAGTYSVLITDANGCTFTKTITLTQPAALAVTPSQTNVSCNGGSNGSATAVVAGGTGPYTYSWAPSGGTAATATGLTAGTYTLTITDANACQTTQSYTLSQPAALVATKSQTNVSCNGGTNGSATVAVTGGTGAYTYSWAPSGGTGATASGLTAGTYTVTIKDANLCQTTQSFTITQPTAITTSAAQTNVACNGGSTGSASVTVSGGTGPYTYSWAPSGGTAATASGLAAGAYTVTITDANGCTATRNFNITQPTAIAATTAQTNVSCNGGSNGSASVTVSGGTPSYTYLWSPSGGTASAATGLTAGTYSVLITDANGCTLTKTITVTQPAALAVAPSQTNVSCSGGSNGSATAVVTGGTGAYTYSWSPSGGTAATATGLTAGTYTLTITDANACQTTQSYTITQPAALVATKSQTNVSCNGGSNGSATVAVTGGTGAYTYAWAPSGGTGATASGLVSGTYTVTIKDANLCQTTQSFTITQPTAITTSAAQTNVACNGGTTGSASVTASGGAGSYTYSWAPSGGTAATASGLAAGAYTVTITDANGCTATRNFNITQPTAIAATTSQTNVSCNGGSNGSAAVTVSGGTPSYTYLWSPSGGTASAATGLIAGTYSVLITDANGCTLTKTITVTQPAALAVAPSQTNVSCNGGSNGSATAVVTGGTGAYTYSWSPTGGTASTATGLTAGTYTLTITDANACQTTQSYTITQPAALVATPSQTNVLCNGSSTGTATVTVTGGTGVYTYAWSPSGGTGATATGLAAGTYTVTIKDANLCQTTQSFTITQPTAITVSASQSNVSCNGGATGSAAVTVSGGTGPYTYSWAPSGGTAAFATGLTAGTYTVTIKDANLCQTTQSFTITQPTAIIASASQSNVACNGGATGSATVVVSGGTGAYTYLWAPSGGTAATATGLTAGTYTVTIKDANLCQTTRSFTITQPSLIALTASTLPQAQVANIYSANLGATGGVGTYTYSVASGNLPNGLSLSPAGVISGTPTVSGTFNFDVKVTDSGCGQSSTLSFSITAITSDQTITFTTIPTQIFGNGPVTLAATSTSGLTVSFASDNPAVASISGNVLTINGAGTANITASQAGGSGYNPAPNIVQVLTVNKATASITLSNLAQIYNGTAKSATAVTTPAGLSGVSLSYNGSATVPTSAGTYAVVASLNNANYAAPNVTGSLVIAPKGITVTADAKSKTYGSADPALSYTVAAGSLVGTDAITGSLSRATGENVGTYLISQNTLTAGSNYTITYTPASLSITPKGLIITADNKTRLYGVANPALTVSYNGFISGEGSTVLSSAPLISTTATLASPSGTYPITASGAAAANYSITYVPGSLVISATSQSITFAALANKLSTDAPFTLTATATSGLAVSYSSSDVSVARIINGNQVEILKAGVVTITANQAGNGNYTAAAAVSQSLTILDNPAPIISIVSSKGNSISKGITTVLTASGAL
ncbi:MBG domain-containing protein, partial [Pedobacter nototheniae]|uniref:MBG domain-containing protein n=1 Tax=Pedobacter nototheniae TaxID=2488994 RepID=UPI0013F4B838